MKELIIEVATSGNENVARCSSLRKNLSKINIIIESGAGEGYYGCSAMIVRKFSEIGDEKKEKLLKVLSKLSYFSDLEIFERNYDLTEFAQEKGVTIKKRGEKTYV